MGYANPVEMMGYRVFADACKTSGVDGVIIVDYPPEESKELVGYLYAKNIDPIYLLAPTTSNERIAEIAKLVRGYAYYVSLRGVTGASHIDADEVKRKLEEIRKHIKLPIGVGFGIRDAQTAKLIAGFADAVVVGSRLVQEIENSKREQLNDNLSKLVKGLRSAMDQ
jgi:tryptophan synthase alpha chain